VALTSYEFRVLSYLMHHRGRVVSRAELTEHIYAQDFDRDSNTVEVFIARLRRKLGGPFIETVRWLGYRLRPHPAERHPGCCALSDPGLSLPRFSGRPDYFL
jgi:two-component system OmpR family response regulator